jgi:hypothetical protein
MVKTMSFIGMAGIAASIVLAIVGAFVSIHFFVTALIAFTSSVALQGIASNRK